MANSTQIRNINELFEFLVTPLDLMPGHKGCGELSNLYGIANKIMSSSKSLVQRKFEAIDTLLTHIIYAKEWLIMKNIKCSLIKEYSDIIDKYIDFPWILAKNLNYPIDRIFKLDRLVLLVTHSCQLRCKYCSVRKFKSDMPFLNVKKSVDLLFTSKNDEVELQFFGGEPLLKYDMIKQAVDYAESLSHSCGKKIKFLLTTNGIGLSNEVVDFCRKHKIVVEFSLDGDLETQLKNRVSAEGENYYDKVINNLSILSRSGVEYYIISVILPDSTINLSRNIASLLNKGFMNLQINYALGQYWDDDSTAALFSELETSSIILSRHKSHFVNFLQSRREPVVLNAEVTVDCDGAIFLETGICLEQDFQKLKNDFRLGTLDEVRDINTFFPTRSRNFKRLVDVYSKENGGFRKIILNNVRLGMKMNNFLLNLRKSRVTAGSKKSDTTNPILPDSDNTLTLKCNNNCVFCPRELLSMISTPESPELVKKSLAKIRESSDSITLSGGEVTIMDNLFDVLKLCQDLKFRRVSMITNGRRLSDIQFASEIIRNGVTDFGLSIYSTDPKHHDQITRVKGSLHQALLGLKNLLRLKVHVWVNITISRINQDSISQTIEELYKLGVREFQLISVVTGNPNLFYDTDLLQYELKKICLYNLNGATLTFRGFKQGMVPKELYDSKDIKYVIEDHGFNTFLPLDCNSQEYLNKVGHITSLNPDNS